MDKKAIGGAIKKYRKRASITQKQLAKMIEKSESTIQKYESGEIEAPLSVLEQISDCLGLEIAELLDNTNFIYDLWEKTDDAVLNYLKALGYEFKTHPSDSNHLELLVRYGYSYDISYEVKLALIEDIRWYTQSRFDKLMEDNISSKKIIQEYKNI